MTRRYPKAKTFCMSVLSIATRKTRQAWAKDPATPVEFLDRLAYDPCEGVRYAAAGNPSTRPLHLAKLASDCCPLVRSAVCENPNTMPDVLRAILSYERNSCINDIIHDSLAKNPNLPDDVCIQLEILQR
jgi:hypothetical protein